MPLGEHVYSVLIVSASEKFAGSLRTLLRAPDYEPVCAVGSVGEAQRSLQERTFDLVIINSPLPDDFGRRLAIDISMGCSSTVLFFVRSELYDETYAKVRDYGVFAIRKPTTEALVSQALDWLCAASERLKKLEKKAVSLEDKMAEIRLVNHAKWALIDSCKMTEEDAHRYIEKQAMDRCVSRRTIAEGILQTYKQT